MASSNQNEPLLLARISQGNEYAFEITFLKYYDKLCDYTWKYVRCKNISEEIVQDVFADMWQNREQLDPAGNLRGLLFVSVKNKALDHIKHQKITKKYAYELWRKRNKTLFSHDNQKLHKETLMHRDIYEAIDNLPPKARRVFLLNREEGLTYQEIANYLAISIKTVESQMSRVLRILRNRLSHLSIPILILASWLF